MKVIFPHMTLPAANRYTKVFPVICRVGLMLNFYALAKKAMRRLLEGKGENSDDDAILVCAIGCDCDRSIRIVGDRRDHRPLRRQAGRQAGR